jgi:hypothetical protein
VVDQRDGLQQARTLVCRERVEQGAVGDDRFQRGQGGA